MDLKIWPAHTRHLPQFASHEFREVTVRESPSVPENSAARTAVIAAVIFIVAHFALLVGITTPEKFYFDEVHYVPAARQMLEPVMPSPMLNPMHPPLAKQMIALSIRTFGDVPLGWRYPGVLFGSLAIVAMYLCGLALFAAQGPAIAAACSPSSTRCCSCNRGSRCWIFLRWRSACSRSRRSCTVSARRGRIAGSRSPASPSVFRSACKWSGLFALAVCIVIVAVIRLMQSWRTQFADGNAERLVPARPVARFQILSFRRLLRADPGGRLSRDLRAALRPVASRSARSPAPDFQRQHHDRDRGPHLYEFVAVLAVSGAAGLVSVRQDRRRPDCGGGLPRQSRWCCGRRCRRSRSACATGS